MDFSIKIYKRWGGDVVYESADVIYLDNFSDNNICNDNNLYQEYYKMGEWDGKLENGEEGSTRNLCLYGNLLSSK